jgi:hypothetical protein
MNHVSVRSYSDGLVRSIMVDDERHWWQSQRRLFFKICVRVPGTISTAVLQWRFIPHYAQNTDTSTALDVSERGHPCLSNLIDSTNWIMENTIEVSQECCGGDLNKQITSDT